VLVLDQAGWHPSDDVGVPEHGHRLFLPPHAPQRQPCEHRWQFTDAPLVNRHCRDVDALEDVQLARCAVLQERRALIRSATRFSWWPKPITKLQG